MTELVTAFKLRVFRSEFKSEDLTNHYESRSFLKTALAWRGSVSPLIIPRVLWCGMYSTAAVFCCRYFPDIHLSIEPFEYTGAVLGLLLVARLNAGTDRWWEARKIWGGVVNQSRNLAILGTHNCDDSQLVKKFLGWLAIFPYTMKETLRGERALSEAYNLIGREETRLVLKSRNMPVYVSAMIAGIIREMRTSGVDGFAYQRMEKERSQLVDWTGACERIRNTPIPFVMAIKTRRFIFIFLLLLPFAVIQKAGLFTPFIMMITSYPLFCLDEIGVELQNPFAKMNLSHLPLNDICKNIEKTILSLEYPEHSER